ncbi:MAG: nucleoside deaminase [Bacteroidetes bacterium]|nr:nucleoside deaminase [Bacteroidota bacterium]
MNFSVFSDDYYMGEAIKEAQKALEIDEVPVGAIIVCNNQIIAKAHNLTEKLNDVTAHAEMQAITAASEYLGGKYLKDCTIYITLEPCLMCAGALQWSQISKIVYGADDEKRGFSIYNQSVFHPKTVVKKGFRKEECSKLLKDYFKSKRE